MDLDARLLTVNQQFLKIGGYFYDEVIGASTYDFVAGLDPVFLGKKTAKFIEKRKAPPVRNTCSGKRTARPCPWKCRPV